MQASLHASSSSRCCQQPLFSGRPVTRVCTRTYAVKREIEPAYFQDVFAGAAERIFGSSGLLKKEETLVLVESVRSTEHAFKTLDLIVRHLENRAGQDVSDWHYRKKYYLRLCELALKLERGPDIIFAIFGNLQRFQVQTYFAKEVIRSLGPKGAHPGVLLRVAELTKLQRGPADKGVRSAYAELVDVLAARNTALDQEFLPRARADLKALRSTMIKVSDAPPVTAVPPAMPSPLTAAGVAPAPVAVAAVPVAEARLVA